MNNKCANVILIPSLVCVSAVAYKAKITNNNLIVQKVTKKSEGKRVRNNQKKRLDG